MDLSEASLEEQGCFYTDNSELYFCGEGGD